MAFKKTQIESLEFILERYAVDLNPEEAREIALEALEKDYLSEFVRITQTYSAQIPLEIQIIAEKRARELNAAGPYHTIVNYFGLTIEDESLYDRGERIIARESIIPTNLPDNAKEKIYFQNDAKEFCQRVLQIPGASIDVGDIHVRGFSHEDDTIFYTAIARGPQTMLVLQDSLVRDKGTDAKSEVSMELQYYSKRKTVGYAEVINNHSKTKE
jgi:hypothetical protein